MWPCHESAEFNDLTPENCRGREIFGSLIAQEQARLATVTDEQVQSDA